MFEPAHRLEKQIKEEKEWLQLNEVEMTDDWEDEAPKPVFAKKDVDMDMDMDDFLETETPRFESLSVKDEQPTPFSGVKRKRSGDEDVFTRDSVKKWQPPRIKAWESRYLVSIESCFSLIRCSTSTNDIVES